MASQEEIDGQLQRLEIYRDNLAVYLRQRAQIGDSYLPIALVNSINDARDNYSSRPQLLTGTR